MEKETVLTNRQEKLLKTAIVRTLTDKAQKYLNDKEVTKMFPMIADMTEKIVIEFNEANLVDKANKEIREDLEKEKFPQERTD
jgi:hypothetical protein